MKNISRFFFLNSSGTRSFQQKGIEMPRCERYTGRGGEYREVFIENSRERRCSVTKDETCNNRGICSFYSSLVLSPNGFQTVGLQVRVPSENLLLSPPYIPLPRSRTSPSASSASPPAVISSLPHPGDDDVGGVAVACS